MGPCKYCIYYRHITYSIRFNLVFVFAVVNVKMFCHISPTLETSRRPRRRRRRLAPFLSLSTLSLKDNYSITLAISTPPRPSAFSAPPPRPRTHRAPRECSSPTRRRARFFRGVCATRDRATPSSVPPR